MNKYIRKNTQKAPCGWRVKDFPSPRCWKLLFIGLPILLLGLCDIAVRLHGGLRSGATGMMLLLAYDVECLVAGLAILVGGVLLIDYVERSQEHSCRSH